jgi:hypothetical protein
LTWYSAAGGAGDALTLKLKIAMLATSARQRRMAAPRADERSCNNAMSG